MKTYLVVFSRHEENVPLDAFIELAHVNSGCDFSLARFLFLVEQINLESVVGPRGELHETVLFVKRKIFDVYFTCAFIKGRRFPDDLAGRVDGGLVH